MHSRGILQADAYGGYNELYNPSRAEGPITSALCWAHARRQFFELADIAANARRGKNAGAISPIALEAVKRIGALFEIERSINGVAADERLRIRKEQSAPLLEALEAWLREQRGRMFRGDRTNIDEPSAVQHILNPCTAKIAEGNLGGSCVAQFENPIMVR